MAKKAIEDHQQTISARLRPVIAKKSETAVLEIFCRTNAPVSANNSGDCVKSKGVLHKDQKSTVASSQKFDKNLDCINLIVNQNSQAQYKCQSEPPQKKLETLEVFNCKNCSVTGSVKTRGFSNMKIANCKDCNRDGNLQSSGSVLGTAIPTQEGNNAKQPISVIKELSKSPSKPLVAKAMSSKQDPNALPPQKPQESQGLPTLAERFAMPQKLAFPIGRNPCVDGKRDEKSKCPAPKPKPKSCSSPQQGPKTPVEAKAPANTAPQGKSATKTNAQVKINPQKSDVRPSSLVMPKENPQPNNPQPEKLPPPPSVGFSLPMDSAFPSGRNPCTDGEKDGKKSKSAALKPEPKKKTKEDSSMKSEKLKASSNNDCKQEKKEETCPRASLDKEATTVSSGSPKSKKEPPASVAPQAKPTKKKSSRQGAVKPKKSQVNREGPSVKANASQKPAHKPESKSTEEKLPPLPSSSFSMPLLSAFPMGRNPCRDGPRGASGKKCSKPKTNTCGQTKVKPCQSETNSCASKTKTSGAGSCPSKTSLDKTASADIGSLPQKKEKPEDSLKSGESPTSPPPKASSQDVPPPPPAKNMKQSSGVSVDKETSSSKDLSTPAAKTPSPPLPPPPTKEIKEPLGSAPAKAPPQPQSARKKCGEVKSVSPGCNKTKSEKAPKKCSDLGKSPKSSESSDPNVKPELKRFPALPLKQSLASYISSIEPLLTEEELKEEQKITKKFRENEGADLQELLEEEAERCSNWLTPRWTRSAYLTYQAPLTVFSSPGLSFPIQEFAEPNDFLNFTAKAIYAICEFKKLVDQDQIPVVKMGKNHLDNSQFCKIFGTVRKPGRFCDTIEQYSDSDYVVVVYKNNVSYFHTLIR